jgi:hypothetical protein
VAVCAEAVVPEVKDLPDFSSAGYHAGRKAPPDRPATLDVKHFGAAGDGETDDTKALQAALVKAAETGGVVGIPAGRYVLTDVLRVETDGVGIRGAGSDKTVLVCPKSLTEIIRPNRNWSWSGGMICVRPTKGKSARVAAVSEPARAGATKLTVTIADGETVRAGEWLELRWHNDKGKDTLLDHLFGGVIPRHRMGSELRRSRGVRVREWVRIEAVEGNRITLQQPIRIDARPEWRPTLVRRPCIREVSVEGLAFEFPKTNYPGHLKEEGYNAIYVGGAVNCWVRDIRTTHADSGIFVNGSRYCTISDIVITGRKMHHCLSMSWSADCLVTRWRIQAPHVHGTTLSWCAHGNVYADGWGRRLAMDCHRAASFDNLHTNIVIAHGNPRTVRPFRSGGSGPRGPHSARRNVYWNIRFDLEDPDGPPVRVQGHHEWPFGTFVGWHGNRTLQFKPVPGLKQQIVGLNEPPAIENLHRWQKSCRKE